MSELKGTRLERLWERAGLKQPSEPFLALADTDIALGAVIVALHAAFGRIEALESQVKELQGKPE